MQNCVYLRWMRSVPRLKQKILRLQPRLKLRCLAAASAFTHPLVDVQQTKHILGPAAYAALAVEIKNNNDPFLVMTKYVGQLLKMPNRTEGESRIDKIMYDLDVGLRNKY